MNKICNDKNNTNEDNKNISIPSWYTNSFNKDNDILLKDYLDIYLDKVKLIRSESTYKNYNNYINRYIKKYIGDIYLKDLSPYDIDKMYTILKSKIIIMPNSKLKNNKLSSEYIYCINSCLKSALTDAKKNLLITINPCDYIKTPKRNKYESTYLNINDAKILLKEISKNKFSDYYLPTLIALTMGLRKGEILGLKYTDINFKTRELNIQRTFTGTGNKISFNTPKTKNSIRKVIIPQIVLDELILKRDFFCLEKTIMGKDFNKGNYIFINNDGRIIKPQSWDSYFKRTLERCHLKDMRIHDLRHTNASILLSLGINMKLVSYNLGHSNIKTTLDIYEHVDGTLDKSAARKIDKAIEI